MKREFDDGIFRYEKIILCVIGILLVSSLYCFFYPAWLMSMLQDSSYGDRIANLSTYQQDVRWKRGSSFSWAKSHTNQTLFNGDLLFVGENSKAKVRFSNGDDIVINENSLVRVTKNRKGQTADLRFGDFRAMLKKGSELRVKYAGTVKTIKAEEELDFVIRKTDEESQIYINKGSLKIDDSAKILTEGVGFVVKEKAVEEKPLEELAIKDVIQTQAAEEEKEEVVALEEVGQDKISHKKGILEDSEQFKTKLRISKDSEDSGKGSKETPENSSWSFVNEISKLDGVEIVKSQGKVESPKVLNQPKEDASVVDKILSFLQIKSDDKQDSVPIRNYHIHHEKIEKKYEAQTVDFKARWKKKKGVSSYRVQVAEDQSFKNIKYERLVQKNFVHGKIVNYEQREMFFRVLPKQIDGRTPASIEFPIHVDFETGPYLKAPETQYPENKAEFVVQNQKSSISYFFIWSPINLADKFELQLSDSSDFKNLTLNEVVDTNYLSVKKEFQHSTYFLRVRSIGAGQISPWSKTAQWQFTNFKTAPVESGDIPK